MAGGSSTRTPPFFLFCLSFGVCPWVLLFFVFAFFFFFFFFFSVLSLASQFRLGFWLLFACDFPRLFPCFLLLLFGDAGAQTLRVDFEEGGCDAQCIVILTLGCALGGA